MTKFITDDVDPITDEEMVYALTLVEQIERLMSPDLSDKQHQQVEDLSYMVRSFSARIHKEQEDRKTVEDLCRSIRHVTIKECAERVELFMSGSARTVLSAPIAHTIGSGLKRYILELLEKRP